jgi:hypothetical protein
MRKGATMDPSPQHNSPVAAPARKLHGDPAAAARARKWVAAGVVAAILFAALNVYLAERREDLPDEVAGVVIYDDLPDDVVAGPVDYARHPPAGGPHAALAQLCGFYGVPIADEHAVASLATGAVWIAHRPDLPAADVGVLRDAVEGEYDVLLAPYPGLEAPAVLTAWGRQLVVADVHDERIPIFIQIYRNADWAPDAGATCSRGVGPPAP